MCGLHWYRQEIEKADGDDKKLNELKKMLEERFNISENSPTEKDHKNVEAVLLYNEIIARKK